MRVAILTIGDELLQGHVVDTNFTRLATWFAGRGHPVVEHASVGDVPAEISRALRDLLSRADLVVCSGGLGPTPDDRTVAAVAEALGREVIVSDEVLARLEAQYRAAGRTMQRTTRKIAEVVEGAKLLENRSGQAPGQWIESERGTVLLLPGVPSELIAITTHALGGCVPEVSGEAMTTFRTVAVPESRLAEMLAERGVRDVAYLPWAGGVDVRVRASGREAVRRALEQACGHAVLGTKGERVEQILFERLRERGQTLAAAESITGGRVGAQLVSVPGVSEVFLGSIVAYANEVKTSLLGVRASTLDAHGAVSEEVAREMAEGARARTGATWAVATTGIAGPTGATETKPVGLVCFGLVGPDRLAHAHARVFAGDREGVVARSAVAALDLVRRAALGHPLPETRR